MTDSLDPTRRNFLKAVSAGAALATTGVVPSVAFAEQAAKSEPESLVKKLHESLNESRRQISALTGATKKKKRGLLRTRVANNWQITEHNVTDDFYSADQQEMIRAIFLGLIHPDWHKRYDQQLDDDCGGWGDQSIAIFGEPEKESSNWC